MVPCSVAAIMKSNNKDPDSKSNLSSLVALGNCIEEVSTCPHVEGAKSPCLCNNENQSPSSILAVKFRCPPLFSVHSFGSLVLLFGDGSLSMVMQLFWWRRLVLVFSSRVFGLDFVMGSLLELISLFYFCNGLQFYLGIVDCLWTFLIMY